MPSLNFRLSDKTCQFNKETKISCPASLKQNEGFIYADNPDRGENILRTNFFSWLFRQPKKLEDEASRELVT